MSMSNYANSGYLVTARELREMIKPDKQSEFDTILANDDWEAMEALLLEELSIAPTVFIFNDVDESEDLEAGEMYAVFNNHDLFTFTPTKNLIELQNNGIKPFFTHWITFG